MKKILCCFLVLLMLFSVAACAQRDDSGGDDNKPPVVDPGGDSEGFIPRKKQEMPVAKIVDTDNDYGADSGWAGDAYASLDLGSVYLQDVINDTVYDWGHSVIYEDGTYKMWWVRPAIYDSIYYAESKDLKNWTNVQRVICLSPNSTNVKKYDNIKGMIGKPSVLHVDGTYYMYFEAPASEDPDITQTVLEWDNQVLLATSSDGIEWEFYCDENGEPIPVIAMPEELMGNTNDKEYGAGQPSAFYKDGKFYVTYCYVIYSQNIAEIRVASSEDGKTFGDVSTHRKISGGNGYGVTYNTKTEKYMMATPEKIYESDTLDFNSAKSYTYYTYDTSSVQTGFCEFVKNPSGLVDTETFYTIHLQGAKSTTGDWRGEHKTWDGHIHAVNPCEYENRPLTLPNGGKATEKNIQEYRDRTQVYSRPTAEDKTGYGEGKYTFDYGFYIPDAYEPGATIRLCVKHRDSRSSSESWADNDYKHTIYFDQILTFGEAADTTIRPQEPTEGFTASVKDISYNKASAVWNEFEGAETYKFYVYSVNAAGAEEPYTHLSVEGPVYAGSASYAEEFLGLSATTEYAIQIVAYDNDDNVIGYSQLAKFKTISREEALNPGGDKDDTDKDDPNKDDTEKGCGSYLFGGSVAIAVLSIGGAVFMLAIKRRKE